MLSPAHKMIEYLIRRYHVQEHNVDSIMRCILPFHQTLLFARLLQILSIAGTKWDFLADAQRNGSPVPRETLSQKCLSTPAVLEFVCDIAGRSAKRAKSGNGGSQYKASFNLYVATVLECLAGKAVGTAAPSERVVTVLLPHLLAGLKAKRCTSYQLASYIVLTQLCAR